MSPMTPACAGVSLEALLAAKERRAQRQTAWLTAYAQPLISLTLVTPGPVKDTEKYRAAMREALRQGEMLLQQHGWPVSRHQVYWLATGAEAVWSVAAPATDLKAAAIALEQSHPLGRLWDFDVLCPQNGVIGRRALANSGRRCLICHDLAHACARSRRHPLEQVIAKIEDLLDGWLRTQ